MKLLIVEGNDEQNFFAELLKYIDIVDVSIENVRGKDKFKSEINAILMSSKYADSYTHLAVVGDAEQNANSSFTKIKNILEGNGLSLPNRKNAFENKNGIKTGIFIMPGDFESGMLEDLCMSAAKYKEKAALAKDFVERASKMEEPPRITSKAEAMAYLSIMPVTVPNIGIGAKRGYWDFSCSEMSDIKSFLENFR